jgi:hypothetical protein
MKNAGSITNSPWAKCEVDGLRRLPQQREADRDQRVDASGREPRDEELDEVSHLLLSSGVYSLVRHGRA